MIDLTHRRFGHCCKWIPEGNLTEQNKKIVYANTNTRTTTITSLKKLSKSEAEGKIANIITHNFQALSSHLNEIMRNKPKELKMVRLGSDILPGYTEPFANELYKNLMAFIELEFRKIGQFARKHNIRLSFHPGQFTQLNSSNSDILSKSIVDFEYHAMMAEFMGYGSTPYSHGFEINIHGGGKQHGLDILINTIKNKLSPTARNLISIENDEFSFGLDDLLVLEKHCAILLDVHHHWIHDEEYIQPNDARLDIILNSWKGIRPELHFALSHENELPNHSYEILPDIKALLSANKKKSKLRAHSNYAWNKAAIDYVLQFSDRFDICFEGKMKNLGSQQIYNRAKEKGII